MAKLTVTLSLIFVALASIAAAVCSGMAIGQHGMSALLLASVILSSVAGLTSAVFAFCSHIGFLDHSFLGGVSGGR